MKLLTGCAVLVSSGTRFLPGSLAKPVLCNKRAWITVPTTFAGTMADCVLSFQMACLPGHFGTYEIARAKCRARVTMTLELEKQSSCQLWTCCNNLTTSWSPLDFGFQGDLLSTHRRLKQLELSFGCADKA